MQQESEGYISRRLPVPEAFGDLFTHFYTAANHSKQPIHKTLLPTFQTMLVLSFDAVISFSTKAHTDITIDKCLVLGPVKQPIDYILSPGSNMLVANFKSDGFYRFFGRAMITGLPMHPDALLHENCFTHLWRVLKPLPTAEDQTQLILDFCRPYIKQRPGNIGPLIRAAETSTTLKSVAGETRQSERNVQLLQKKYLGYSAKEISRYERFLKAIETIQDHTAKGEKVDWFDIIHDCGYYDQPQLIHDFNHFLHLSPSRFLRFQQDICHTT